MGLMYSIALSDIGGLWASSPARTQEGTHALIILSFVLLVTVLTMDRVLGDTSTTGKQKPASSLLPNLFAYN